MRLRFILALSAVGMGAALSGLDQTVVSTALPHIISSLQRSDLPRRELYGRRSERHAVQVAGSGDGAVLAVPPVRGLSGTALIGAIAGAGAGSAGTLRSSSIHQAWFVQLTAALVVILMSAVMADLPLRSQVVEGSQAAGPALEATEQYA
ncbi:MAG: hypothetical protein KGJ86_04150 [Chloroflexota bacterium]|nr:hypothetical protein [Chloroflexota bacterium]